MVTDVFYRPQWAAISSLWVCEGNEQDVSKVEVWLTNCLCWKDLVSPLPTKCLIGVPSSSIRIQFPVIKNLGGGRLLKFNDLVPCLQCENMAGVPDTQSWDGSEIAICDFLGNELADGRSPSLFVLQIKCKEIRQKM